ncbi:MAG: gatC [Solirubrobacterales bacterium]|jgi:aspartyl-tRNA(Asn)/glutamyl-tRNA(Gln) amidotransferase subunit C|nr:gatC [Solirubrobacterales bacterium]
MISRDQVLHVARLARLELTDEETVTMSEELSKVLGHIEKLSELDLTAVAPTSHVVAVDVALRADEPHVSLSQEVALAAAPDVADGGFRVPSPQA